jgi:1,4-dihydroxy-2-naphthoate octaprenyltransferase
VIARWKPVSLTLIAILAAWVAWSVGDEIAGLIGLGELTLLVRLGVMFIALSLLEIALAYCTRKWGPVS